MKKQVIFWCMLMVILLFICSVGAWAAIDDAKIILDEDFTRPEGEIGNPDWKPDGWELDQNRGEIERVHEDGYVELKQNGTSGNAEVIYRLSGAIPSKFTLMYDIYWGNYGSRMGYQTSYINGYNLSINSAGTVTTFDGTIASGYPDYDKWYTYVIQVDNGYGTYFRKSEDDSEFTKVAENVKLAPSTINYFRVYVYDGSANGQKQVSAKVDNVKIFAGTYLTDSKIEISEDKSKITGKLTIGSAEIPADGMMETTVIMTAYDKKGKFMNIVTDTTQCLFYGEGNEITVEMPCSNEFYEAIKGGTIELYVWDSMEGIKPICDIVTLDVR